MSQDIDNKKASSYIRLDAFLFSINGFILTKYCSNYLALDNKSVIIKTSEKEMNKLSRQTKEGETTMILVFTERSVIALRKSRTSNKLKKKVLVINNKKTICEIVALVKREFWEQDPDKAIDLMAEHCNNV